MSGVKYAAVLLVTFRWILVLVSGDPVRNEDICGAGNGRRLYLQLGEKGVLYARNASFISDLSTSAINGSRYRCSLQLVTCPSCVIIATFRNIALPHRCIEDGGVATTVDGLCRCDYVWLSEPPYEAVSGSPFCGSYAPITYRSSTRTLSIDLFYSRSHKRAFTIEYAAERNRRHFQGTGKTASASVGPPTMGPLNVTGDGILTSPFFPARYPRDLGLEYVITCPKEALSCRVRVMFSDFQLATVSIMEFYDWNGQRLDVSSGAQFRSPVIVTSGPSLSIRFHANGGTGLGYKGYYSFIIGHTHNESVQPITDCGGYVENLGGTITMLHMVGQGVKTYDCVWLIRPPKHFSRTKTHMYLRVVDFADMAGDTELIIRQGLTALSMSLEVIGHPASRFRRSLGHREHVVPITSGFRVSLRGTFGPSSHLAIAYAAFGHVTDCFTGTDFPCQNHRCIPSQLNCDGFDHCGDNSDEPATCLQDWETEPRDRKWHVNKANYYFPKIDRYPDLRTATLMFVASSLGFIVLIWALIIFLYRIGIRARQQRQLRLRLGTISELLDGATIDEISTSDDPPGYEAPPGYEEVTRLTLPKKARCFDRESCNENSPSQHDEAANSSRYLTVENGSDDHAPRIPESPPPPYIMAPESASRNVNLAGLSTLTRQICPIRRTWFWRSAQCLRSTYSDRPRGNGRSFLPTNTLDTYSTRVSDIDDAQVDKSDERNCLCDDACACAIGNYSTTTTEQRTLDETSDSEREQAASEFSCARKIDEHQEEDASSISKGAIVRLLGCKLMKASLYHHHCASLNTTTVSPSSRDTCPSRKFSHRVNRVNGIASAIGTRNGYEKLRDDFESGTESETSLGTNDTARSVVDRRTTRRDNRRHSSCDMDSLYEGIKILEAFLARRSLDIDHDQSVAAILFGTPRHNFARGRAASSPRRTIKGRFTRARRWHSSADVLSN